MRTHSLRGLRGWFSAAMVQSICAVAACRGAPVDVTPALALLHGRVTDSAGAAVRGVWIDARVHASTCESAVAAGGFLEPQPAPDGNGAYALRLLTVDGPGARCVTVIARSPSGAAGSPDSLRTQLRAVPFTLSPGIDTVTLDLTVPW